MKTNPQIDLTGPTNQALEEVKRLREEDDYHKELYEMREKLKAAEKRLKEAEIWMGHWPYCAGITCNCGLNKFLKKGEG